MNLSDIANSLRDYCWLNGEKCLYRTSQSLICLPHESCTGCRILSQNLEFLLSLSDVDNLIESKAETIAEEKVQERKVEIKADAIEDLKTDLISKVRQKMGQDILNLPQGKIRDIMQEISGHIFDIISETLDKFVIED